MQPTKTNVVATILIALIASGCNDRATQIAIQAADRQAEQNRAMIGAQKDVADGSRQLVASDADARRHHVELHRELQSERARLSAQWKQLEAERQGLAKERRKESLYAPIAQALSGLLLVVMTLGFSWYALSRNRTGDCNVELEEFLIQEFLSDSPTNLSNQLLEDKSHRLLGRQASQYADADKENGTC